VRREFAASGAGNFGSRVGVPIDAPATFGRLCDQHPHPFNEPGIAGGACKDSRAPRGSLYHYLPKGKKQLIEEAIQWTSEQVLMHQRAFPGGTASDVLRWFIDLWRQSVLRSGGSSGCAVAAVALDTDVGNMGYIQIIRATFQSWVTLLANQLEAAGVTAGRAASIATAALASMEGALILCRAEGGSGPLEDVASELLRLLPPETTGAGPGLPDRAAGGGSCDQS
jgi:hypothetical protein